MKLILKKAERTKGLFGGIRIFVLTAQMELSPEEKKVVDSYRLDIVSFYKSAITEDGPKQYFGATGSPNFLDRMLLKEKNLEIKGSTLINGMTLENENILELMDMEIRIKEAADLFAKVVKAASVFIGEEIIDL